MPIINQIMAPIRSLVRFPLFQLAVVVALILWLQGADEPSIRGHVFNGLDRLVGATVDLVSSLISVRSFTKSWLTSGFWIAYVYVACLLILWFARLTIRETLDFAGRHNVLWLRHAIARERGIAAYRAWVPFERIRPAGISQQRWEETYAWPADESPPYRPLGQRILRGAIGYAVAIAIMLGLLQAFTPFPVLTWLGRLV